MLQTILITGGTQHDRTKKATAIVESIDTKPEYLLAPAEDLSSSLKIGDVRDIQRQIHLRPRDNAAIVVLLTELQRATPETQNALLKLFEEPPEYVRIIATVDNKDKLLQTIVSRARVVKASNGVSQYTKMSSQDYEILKELTSGPAQERLERAAAVSSDKQTAIQWLRQVVIIFRYALLAKHNVSSFRLSNEHTVSSSAKSLAATIGTFSRALSTLEYTNTTPRLLMENLLLNLPLIQGKKA